MVSAEEMLAEALNKAGADMVVAGASEADRAACSSLDVAALRSLQRDLSKADFDSFCADLRKGIG